MIALAVILAIASFGLLGLAIERHRDRWRRGMRPTARQLRRRRSCAWGLLILSFGATVAGEGWIFGPVMWTGIVMLAAGTIFLLLNFLPRLSRFNR